MTRGAYHWVFALAEEGLSTPAVFHRFDELTGGVQPAVRDVPEALTAALRAGGAVAGLEVLDAQALAGIDGTMSVPEAVDSTALATRQLASRQIKWFRRDPRLHWIDVALTEAGQCTDSERSRLTRQAWELVCARRGVA